MKQVPLVSAEAEPIQNKIASIHCPLDTHRDDALQVADLVLQLRLLPLTLRQQVAHQPVLLGVHPLLVLLPLLSVLRHLHLEKEARTHWCRVRKGTESQVNVISNGEARVGNIFCGL